MLVCILFHVDSYITKMLKFSMSCVFCPQVLTNMSSGDIKAKEGDLVNLLCSAQGELPITFSWEKDQKPLESLTVKEGINLVGIIILAILVVILMAILSYLIYKIHQLKSLQASKSKESNDSKHVYEIPVTNDQNYKQVENEQSKYTAVKKPGERDDDDHVYSHLNEVDKGYVNQKKLEFKQLCLHEHSHTMFIINFYVLTIL